MTFKEYCQQQGLKWDGKFTRSHKVDDRRKTNVTVRYSPHIINQFKATGKGWQTRMNTALADWLKHNNPADLNIK